MYIYQHNIFKVLMALCVSLSIYILLVQVFSLPVNLTDTKEVALSIDELAMKSIEMEYSLVDSKPWIVSYITSLAIYTLFQESDSVISGLYVAIYFMLLLHILALLFSQYFRREKLEALLTWTTYAAAGFGTLGTMYAIALALNASSLEVVNLNDIIQGAFFDAIYTTIVGIVVSIINQGLSIFIAPVKNL